MLLRRTLLAAFLGAAAALRAPLPKADAGAACSSPTRRLLVPAALAAVLLPSQAARAADAAAGDCLTDCNRECNLVAPGNQGYCATQCADYCKDNPMGGQSDVLRADVSECNSYKTAQAKEYCQKQVTKAATPPNPMNLQMNNGIFGDSGVAYSKGVEDLFASAFGATRQNKSLKDANVDEFAGEVTEKAKAAFFGN